jgi:hypothetical protein
MDDGNQGKTLARPSRPGIVTAQRTIQTGQVLDAPLNENATYWEDRRLDGSRGYWRYREEGRFGSHPSFDSCDDESAP